jgi:hypothetical protein
MNDSGFRFYIPAFMNYALTYPGSNVAYSVSYHLRRAEIPNVFEEFEQLKAAVVYLLYDADTNKREIYSGVELYLPFIRKEALKRGSR